MEQKEMRAIYAEELIKLAQKDERIVVLEADLMSASGTKAFAKVFPNRIFDIGAAESNMVGIAAGLSAGGKIPFANTFGCFASRRAYDQFFISCCYAKQNVKLVGTDPGVSAAYNGGTHMPLEDIALMRVIPQLVVFEPADPISLKELLYQAAYYKGSTYMRLHRKVLPSIYQEKEIFTLGKGKIIFEGKDGCLIAVGGICVNEALKARSILKNRNFELTVIDMHTIKPLDEELLRKIAKQTDLIISIENHQIINGLGSAIAEFIAENSLQVKFKRIGIQDQFGEVGTQAYLQQKFGLTAEKIVETFIKLKEI